MSKTIPQGLTAGQARLLEQHRRGLARLARVLATKIGRAPTDVMFVLAHQASDVGCLALEKLGERVVRGKDAVIIPGLATELSVWIERLALRGPVVHCDKGKEGVPVIVIDASNEMALCRVTCLKTAAGSDSQYRPEIPSA